MVLPGYEECNIGSCAQIKAVILQYLDHLAYEDALYLAEIYHDTVNSDESILLLCDCLLRLGRRDEVHSLLSPHPKMEPRIRYIFAKCCFDLSKYEECERALSSRTAPPYLHTIFDQTSSEAFAHSLLATVLCESGRVDLALSQCNSAVKKNSFLWSAIVKYIQYGGKCIGELFSNASHQMFPDIVDDKDEDMEDEQNAQCTKKKTPVAGHNSQPIPGAPRKSSRVIEMSTENRRSQRLFSQDSENAGTRARTANNKTPMKSQARIVGVAGRMGTGFGLGHAPIGTLIRKARETKQPLGSRQANNVRSVSSSSTSVSSLSLSSNGMEKDPDEIKKTPQFSQLFRNMFVSLRAMAEIEDMVVKNQWAWALKKLASLPNPVAKNPVALQTKARILFEVAEYSSARDVLQELRRLHPHRVEGMELLSTALWHLQDPRALSSLAQDLTRNALLRPQTWCAAGNCFSLQRQHTQAVECMERALKLDPHFAYAHTLLGHELIFQEEYEKAANSFRAALSISPNDYRAWHGLGLVHIRKEQTALAQVNIAKAVQINPTNRAILCQLAQVEQALGRSERAMQLVDRALALNPKDVACRYNRAKLLYETKRNEECVTELDQLKGMSPDEAYIFHLLGKVHRRLGNTHLALLNYSWATEMDPRGEQMMSHAGEQSYDDDSYTTQSA